MSFKMKPCCEQTAEGVRKQPSMHFYGYWRGMGYHLYSTACPTCGMHLEVIVSDLDIYEEQQRAKGVDQPCR